ncbi:protein stoned-B isoform X2 [Homalodisca vitripennis]|uniref:protein stoned-B isoform X2 n=1 Tax=Homalodisca vitripennis TaxID=197043 RepID=UPI001EEB5778|nr:protein stoned-B isoform X2 [Homalodisca vitripennis]
MANPFLMGDLDAGDTQVSSNSASFNPFLSGPMEFSSNEIENPFMSSLNNTASSNTNPFAFAESDTHTTTDFFSSPAQDLDNMQPSVQDYENIFSTPAKPQEANGVVNDFFGSFVETDQSKPLSAVPISSSARSSIDQSSFLMDNNINFFGSDPIDLPTSREGSGTSTPKGAPPRRPPPPGLPPRPGLPPSKETKDLILSVTGAMEATSSHLLDRLQATRTPSPTPIRDLNSPSPTPDMFGDLLGVDDVHKDLPPPSSVQEVNLLGDMEDDFLSTTSMQPSQMAPIDPVPTSVPPVVPVAPTAQITPVPPTTTAPPPRPLPPRPPERPKLPPNIPPVQENIIDFNEPLQQPPISKQPDTSSVNIISSVQPQEVRDIFDSQPLEETPVRNTEPELDFSSPYVSAEPSNVLDNSNTTAFTDTGFESNGPSTFTSVFDSDIESTKIPESSSIFAAEVAEVNTVIPEPIVTSSVFEDTQQESTFPTSPFDQNINGVEDTGFVGGFDSEMNVSVREVSPAVTDNNLDNSAFSVPSSQTDNMFFNNVDTIPFQSQATDLFAPTETVLHTTPVIPSQPFNIFGEPESFPSAKPVDDFDAFAAKFESAGFDDNKNTTVSSDPFDPFSSSQFGTDNVQGDASVGFGAEDNFDAFLATQEPATVLHTTPRFSRGASAESDEHENDFNVFIKPKQAGEMGIAAEVGGVLPALAPPPRSPINNAFQDTSPRFNPFDKTQEIPAQVTDNIFAQAVLPGEGEKILERTDSQETPPTPLFDEDVSQPLEPFPRIHYVGSGWEMQLRQPNKKKITGQRFWKKVFMKLVYQGENPVLQLFNNKDDKDPFQELPLQPCYSVSDIGAQQYDNFGKIFTVKLQFIFYKERPGVRPGQVTKAERITNKLSQFAAYAIQGDYQGVKEFGSDLKKLGLPVEHAPQISQLFKIGSQNYEDMKQFSVCVEEALFRLPAHRDRALNYKMEEVQITAVDELYVDQNSTGGVIRQIARVRLFFLGFLSGMPDVELGVNDLVRQGKEVVGRHDIIPVVTEEWIRLEAVEFHSCVQQDEYERTRTIKFKPPDACYIELMRFRVRPPRNRELPLQLRTTMCIAGNKVDLKADVLVPGFSSRKLGQIPCEDVVIRFPIPECWIYLFRVEKHFRYGSVKSAHRRTGKVKGLERFLGAVDNLEPQLMEVTSGQAKYEHQHRAIVWRMPRLPKEGQGAYTTHNLVCHMALTSYDQIPEELDKYCFVEFTMPVTQVSHTTVRSVSISNSDSDSPPEKYVRQLARHEYKVEIEFTQAEGPNDYIAATSKPTPAPAPTPAPIVEEHTPAAADSDSDSSS